VEGFGRKTALRWKDLGFKGGRIWDYSKRMVEGFGTQNRKVEGFGKTIYRAIERL
jgi:hypothetical protein